MFVTKTLVIVSKIGHASHTHSPLKCYMPRIYDRCAPVSINDEDSATVMLDVEFEIRSFVLQQS